MKVLTIPVALAAILIKQWRGALGRTLLVSFRDLKNMPTGGVPTWPYGVVMYQFRNRFIANESSFSHCLPRLPDHIMRNPRYLLIDYVSKGMSVFSAILEEINQSTMGN